MESDEAAIHALVREMVTQSIVPFMENRIMTWNDQVASRRRGISGRFMSLSKRWAGFGSKGSASGLTMGPHGSGNITSSSHYVANMGYYPPEAPEATMRQLADFSLMLRDWRSAHGIYELVRSDFAHDQAWAYHAGANEMAAITSLLLSPRESKLPSESLDQILDNAIYSYITRCSYSLGAIRCLTLATELLGDRGPTAIDHAGKYIGKLLELGIVGPTTQALMSETMANFYKLAGREAALISLSRKRQAGLWNVLSAQSWVNVGRASQAKHRLADAGQCYELSSKVTAGLPFPEMNILWSRLNDQREGGSEEDVVVMDNDVHGAVDTQNATIIAEWPPDPLVGQRLRSQIDDEGFTSSSLE